MPESAVAQVDRGCEDRTMNHEGRRSGAPALQWAYRLVHLDNLEVYLRRGALHAPNREPGDGSNWLPTHNSQVQDRRSRVRVPCGPRGTLLDYVPFYLGRRGPMLCNLHTNRVDGYRGGQRPMCYLCVKIDDLKEAGLELVFTDGHALNKFTEMAENLGDLVALDPEAINARWWANTKEDPDRQRRKQAELLVYEALSLELIRGVAVIDQSMQRQVEVLAQAHGATFQVVVRRRWYY